MARGVKTATDEQIREALIQYNGQPTKAAESLGISYITVWKRCKDNPELEAVKLAYRSRVFNSLHSLTAAAVLIGVMQQPVTDEDGSVIRDEQGKIIYKEVAIPIETRLKHANLLMNMYKGDEGIRDQININTQNEVDLSIIDTETLNILIEAGIK